MKAEIYLLLQNKGLPSDVAHALFRLGLGVPRAHDPRDIDVVTAYLLKLQDIVNRLGGTDETK